MALGGRGGVRRAEEAIFYVFDLLYWNGHDLRGMVLTERRSILEANVNTAKGPIRLSEEVEANGAALLKSACELGLEGIQSEGFLVVGYKPSTKMRGALASLLLAARGEKGLVYVGAVGTVGTGFSDAVAVSLRKHLDSMKTTTPAVSVKGKGLVFVRPELVAEVEFRAWTGEGKLPHASFKGMRDAADDQTIFDIANISA